jgi:diaminopimelate epimerase
MRDSLAFDKYEGTGNDFLVIDASSERDVSAEDAVHLCDRHFGVGADGVLLVLPAREPGSDARMRVLNADGSVPEMCGNGLRCVALRIARAKRSEQGVVVVETDAGVRRCVVDGDDVAIDMGLVTVGDDRDVEVAGRTVTVTLADAGNPHAVLFGAFTRDDARELGPRIATHALFPSGTNVEFAQVEPYGVDLVVWERGVGLTLACGTGACATVAAAYVRGRVASRSLPVRLPGGTLHVALDETGRATLRGPARHVFRGSTVPRP